MPRRILLFLVLTALIAAAAEMVSAQGLFKSRVGITNYTPPSRGLVGYIPAKSEGKSVPPADLVPPPEIGNESIEIDEGSSRISITESNVRGEQISSSAPYLSENLTGTAAVRSMAKTSAVISGNSSLGGRLDDGQFIPDPGGNAEIDSALNESETPLYFSSEPNTYVLTPTGSVEQAGFPETSESLPAPVLDQEPERSGYYSSLGTDWEEEVDESAVSDFFITPRIRRQSCFQQADTYAEYIPNVGERKSGMTSFGGSVRFALPLPDSSHPFMISPRFSWTDLTNPDFLQSELGEKIGLYTAGLQGEWLAPISECFLLDLGVGVSWNSDFKTKSSDSLRITGNVVGIWKWNETARLLFGASYQNLSDWKVVPVFGLSWRPTEDCYVDAVFPLAKIARRITWMKGIPEIEEGNSPYWLYLSGELNGGRWAVEPDGDDRSLWNEGARISYYDYRLLGGVEKKLTGDVNWALEGGLDFARHLTYEGWTPAGFREENIRPKPSGIARLRLTF